MSTNRAEQTLEQEEAAQGQDLFRAPGADRMMEQARDQADASGWIADEELEWPSGDTREAVARRRRDLYAAMQLLESAVARPSGLADWRMEIETALANLERALREHIDQVESETGLFAQVLASSPHLSAEIQSLTEEHQELQAACHEALSMSADWSSVTLRRRTNLLLGRLAIHRQFGAELLYDAYNVDIGTGD